MADKTGIEWTDATWPIVQGCDYESPGCKHCYVPPLLWRLMHNPNPKIAAPLQGLVEMRPAGGGRESPVPVFTGKLALREDRLAWPLEWKAPRRIFVPSHGDIFHESVPDAFLDRIFAVMAVCPQHTFQVLTKRAARMRGYMTAPDVVRRIYEMACDLAVDLRLGVVLIHPSIDEARAPAGPRVYLHRWPVANVWLGVSVEDQARADERVPLLLETPAAKRFLSCEPLLGAVDLAAWMPHEYTEPLPGGDPCKICGVFTNGLHHPMSASSLHWVIAGGESGKGDAPRPMHPDWARLLRDQCKAAGVPFFFKQWGEWAPADEKTCSNPHSGWLPKAGGRHHDRLPEEAELYPENGAAFLSRIGKKAAGALLDGVEHREFPR